ncbi:MAG: sugar phosphate nucleotidyltransferase [Cytophagales bacterium]
MKAIILAGGLGTRLKPFTDVIPKPLLPLGEKSMLEIQIEHLKSFGFQDIYLALNYKADYIKSYLKDGSQFGVNLHYSLEKEPLGTCGPIKLLENDIQEPFLLMNGDILTKANFKEIYDFSCKFENSLLNIVTHIINRPFRFGNIISEGDMVKSIDEKPNMSFEILAGIYVLKPGIFNLIPEGKYFGIDELIIHMLKSKLEVTKYLLEDYWIDIGIVDDYNEAQKAYKDHFND